MMMVLLRSARALSFKKLSVSDWGVFGQSFIRGRNALLKLSYCQVRLQFFHYFAQLFSVTSFNDMQIYYYGSVSLLSSVSVAMVFIIQL